MIAPLPGNELDRLEALYSYNLLDTEAEPVFDNLTNLAAHIAQTPIALVSLIDSDRQWFKSSFGTEMIETERDVAFCAHTILQSEPLVVEDATMDARFADNPLVQQTEPVRFYAGFPIIASSGHPLGTLCVIDHRPNSLTRQQISILTALAAQIELHLELKRDSENELSDTTTRRELLDHLDRELHTTLNGIVSAQQLLTESFLNSDQRNYLEFSSQATDHLVFLIDHLKTLLELSPRRMD